MEPDVGPAPFNYFVWQKHKIQFLLTHKVDTEDKMLEYIVKSHHISLSLTFTIDNIMLSTSILIDIQFIEKV